MLHALLSEAGLKMDRHASHKRKRPDESANAPSLFEESKKRASLKNRIRSLRRLLSRPDLPRTLRTDQKRMLKRLEERQADKTVTAREKKYAEKYKQIKFHETKKAARRLKRATKELQAAEQAVLEANDENKAPLQATLQAARDAVVSAQDDVNYVQWFPKHLKYLGLYATAHSEDAKLAIRKAALRRWAKANAAASAFLPSPPTADAGVDFGPSLADDDDEDDDDDMGGGGSEEEGEGQDDDEEEGSNDDDGDKDSDSGSDSSDAASSSEEEEEASPPPRKKAKTAAEGEGEGQNGKGKAQGKEGANGKQAVKPAKAATTSIPASSFTLPSRPVARKSGAAKKAEELSKALKQGGMVPCDEDTAQPDEDAQADIALDPFFSGGMGGEEDAAPTGLPVFQDMAWPEEDEGEEGMHGAQGRGSGPGAGARGNVSNGQRYIRGPQGSAARWEREHMDVGRYRASEHARRGPGGEAMPGSGPGSGAASRPGPPPPSSSSSASVAPDLSHLSGRKLKRAQRAQQYAAKKSEGGAGGLLPGSGRYTETFYGTDRDPGARLKHEDRMAAGDRAKAKAQSKAWERQGQGQGEGQNGGRSSGAGPRFARGGFQGGARTFGQGRDRERDSGRDMPRQAPPARDADRREQPAGHLKFVE